MMKRLTKALLVCLMVALSSTAVKAQDKLRSRLEGLCYCLLAQKSITDKSKSLW